MKLRRSRLVYSVAAIAGICIGIGTYVISPPDLSGLGRRPQPSIHDIGVEYVFSPFVFDAGTPPEYAIDLRIQLNYPSSLPKDSTILIEAILEIEEIHIPDLQGLTGAFEYMKSEKYAQNMLWQQLESGLLSLELNLPAAEISPDRLKNFSKGRKSAWSVYFPVAGSHEGIITAESNLLGTLNIQQDGEGIVKINVYEPLYSKKNLISLVGILLGPLVSIPGIFAFVREIRKERRKNSPAEKV